MVYILMVVAILQTENKNDINFDVIPFESKSRCVRNIPNVKEQLLKRGFNIVHTECVEKVISKGK